MEKEGTTRVVRWAVWGSCGIARRRTIPEGIVPARHAELVAVYDTQVAANRKYAEALGVAAASSEAELLAGNADVVYIATPVHLHPEQVLAAAKAGKHILCEKPLAPTVKQAEEMLSACREADVRLGTAFMMRFQSQHQAALRMIRAGELGAVSCARAQLSCWYPPAEGAWRQNPDKAGGGALADMGSHCIDLLEMLVGRIAKVSCFIANSVHPYAAEDSAVALLFFENKAIATVHASFCLTDGSCMNSLELYGSKGSLLAKGTIGQAQAGEMLAFLEGNFAKYDAKQNRPVTNGEKISPPPVNMYQAEVEEFSRAILEGRRTSLGGDLGLRNQKVLAACYESARTGQAVDV